jgi:hypothetical protein
VSLNKNLKGGKERKKIREVYGMYIKMKNAHRNYFKKSERKRPLLGIRFGKVVITKLILKKWDARMWIRFVWVMIRTAIGNTGMSSRREVVGQRATITFRGPSSTE